jgi:hypothetical protein
MIRITLALSLLCTVPAVAHDLPDNWIGRERLKNAKGELCCGVGDCFPFDASKIKVSPLGYTFPDGQLVPFDKAGPSIDKSFWRCRWGGETKCVFAPVVGV